MDEMDLMAAVHGKKVAVVTLPRKILRAVFFGCLFLAYGVTFVGALRPRSAPLPAVLQIPFWGLPSASIGLIVCEDKRLGLIGLAAFAALLIASVMPSP
jgi:hypothetical protein